MNPIVIILVISFLGPIIGSLLGILKKPSDKFMFAMLAFAAGVMLSVSFLELIPESIRLSSIYICVIGIILGSVVMYLIDKLIPHLHPEFCQQEQGHNLKKTAVYLLIGIFMHNLPEGLAIGSGFVTNIKLSIIIAIAIAVHNIPEGICTSAPYYYVSKKRLKAFLLSASTAFPTVIGFLIAYFLFPSISKTLVGLIVAATAGIMIYISGDELIPMSCSKDRKAWSHQTIFSLIAGVIFVVLLSSI